MPPAEQTLTYARLGASEPASLRAPGASAPAADRVAHISVHDDLAAVAAEWRAFETYADCTAFQSFDWLSTWQNHVGAAAAARPAVVIGRTGAGAIQFIVPLMTLRRGPLTQLTFLGRDLGDYNAPLLAPGAGAWMGENFAALWQEIRAALRRQSAHRHDLVWLDKMPERVGAQPNPFVQLDTKLHPSGAYHTALAGDWESFYAAKRSSATRRRDKTKRKRLAESGEVRMATSQTAAQAAATLAKLIEQKQRAFARMGVPNMFERPGYVAFFHDLAAAAPSGALAHVSRLEVGSSVAAANFGLIFRGVYYHILASYDDGPLSRFGPGAAHLHELMRFAIEQGCVSFDFTIGDEPYKRDWCDAEAKLYDHISAATMRGFVAARALDGALRLKRAIKQSPVLWPAAQRLRAALASGRSRLRQRDS